MSSQPIIEEKNHFGIFCLKFPSVDFVIVAIVFINTQH